MNKFFIYIAILSVFSACDLFQKKAIEKNSKLLAKVKEYKLYEEDLRLMFPKNISYADSAEVAKDLIYSWAKKKLLLQKAEVNMPSQNDELEELVLRYREDLYINSFKKALIAKLLDTVVDPKEIVDYYEQNKASFKVNEALIKFKYIALDQKHKERSRFRKLFLSKSKNDLFVLDEHQQEFRTSFLSDSIWVRYMDVKREIPLLNTYDATVVLRKNKFIAKIYDGDIYYVYIKDIVNRNEIAPLRYISNTIEKIIIQQRKLQLIHKVEDVLIEDARKDKQLEIY